MQPATLRNTRLKYCDELKPRSIATAITLARGRARRRRLASSMRSAITEGEAQLALSRESLEHLIGE